MTGAGWLDQGIQEMPGGSFTSYVQTDLAAGSELAFMLNGRPEILTRPAGAIIPHQPTASTKSS
ncbi:MAG: hypothetical protein M5U34_41990 [Chloroflexi bacterium]|nr:hypothetical protein [Chloroflexota bacterium]